MTIAGAIDADKAEDDDNPLVEPVAAPLEGAEHKYLIAFAVVLAALMRQRALSILDRELMGQASVIAYSRIYVLSAVLILALIPLLVLVRHPRGAAGAPHILE